ncbi:MAG: hypothetical protein ACO3N7_00210 [Kiritimatiellia bacterium]
MNPSTRLQRWADRIGREHAHQVEIYLTRNRRTMISLRRLSPRCTRIRMHEGFLGAPEEVLENLKIYVLTRKNEAWRTVAAFARCLPPSTDIPSPTLLRTRGTFFDLEKELRYVKKQYFSVPPDTTITWGKVGRPRCRKRQSILFGSWHADRDLILIHPLLDQEWVPRQFIRYLIYHELCHAVARPRRDRSGRLRIHHPQFKALEEQFPRLPQMQELSREILERLSRERQ